MKCRAYELELGDVIEVYYVRHYVRAITDTHFVFWYYDNSTNGKSIEIGKNSKECVRLIQKGVTIKKPKQTFVPVIQFDKDGYEIARYESIKQASVMTGIYHTCICDASVGKTKTAGGYIWKRA